MAMTSAKIASFQMGGRDELKGLEAAWVFSLLLPLTGWTMKIQRIEAQRTDILLTDIVLRRVFSRLGDWSTQRPTLDEKRIEARVRTIPL